MATSSTVWRRLVFGLAAIGLDVRPLAGRVRSAILRSYRAETEARFQQIEVAQRRIGPDLAALQDQLAALRRQGAADAAAFQTQSMALEERAARTTTALAAAQARLAQQIDVSHALHAALDRLSRELSESRARVMVAVVARAAEIAALREQAAAADRAWRQRVSRLETLLVGAAPVPASALMRDGARLPDPAVAIILPTYNRAAVIADAVASVQAQRFARWELVIIDDGGSDDTAEILAPSLTDRRIRLIRQPRLGAAAARNRGIAETTAPLIAYIDSDNLWYPNFLACAVDCLATEPEVDLVYGALVTDDHGLDRDRILWSPFERAAMFAGNFIDTNVLVHRRGLVARYGGWDARLNRLLDWDLLLRYTEDKPAKPIRVLAARYRRCDDRRISDVVPYGPDEVLIRSKWFPPPLPARRPRVLYVAEPDPQGCDITRETEWRCLRAWGMDLVCQPGPMAEAIASVQPDLIHVEGLTLGHRHGPSLARSGLPVTLRVQGSEGTAGSLAAWLAQGWAGSVFAQPHQISQSGLSDPRLIALPAAFDSARFRPGFRQDRRLVAHAARAEPEELLQVTRRLPGHRFLPASATGQDQAADADQRAALLAQAGLYLHLPGPPAEDRLAGHPVAVIEAMACGCYCLVPDSSALALLLGDAGATFRDGDALIGLIRDCAGWSEEAWAEMRHRAIKRAWLGHADRMVLRPLFDAWMALTGGPGPT